MKAMNYVIIVKSEVFFLQAFFWSFIVQIQAVDPTSDPMPYYYFFQCFPFSSRELNFEVSRQGLHGVFSRALLISKSIWILFPTMHIDNVDYEPKSPCRSSIILHHISLIDRSPNTSIVEPNFDGSHLDGSGEGSRGGSTVFSQSSLNFQGLNSQWNFIRGLILPSSSLDMNLSPKNTKTVKPCSTIGLVIWEDVGLSQVLILLKREIMGHFS